MVWNKKEYFYSKLSLKEIINLPKIIEIIELQNTILLVQITYKSILLSLIINIYTKYVSINTISTWVNSPSNLIIKSINEAIKTLTYQFGNKHFEFSREFCLWSFFFLLNRLLIKKIIRQQRKRKSYFKNTLKIPRQSNELNF